MFPTLTRSSLSFFPRVIFFVDAVNCLVNKTLHCRRRRRMVNNYALERLKEIGHQFDNDIFPRVMNGGIVTPGGTAQPITIWAKETQDEQQRQRRSATGPWTGAAGRQRQADRPGEGSTTPPPVSTGLQDLYESELTAVQHAYPGTRVWRQKDGLWLLTESVLLPGIWQKAVFLTGIPFSRRHIVRSWGFWMGTPQNHPTWIGPRHTNFPDGSVCAFEPRDGTWNHGDSLVVLLDLYTLWALRQLHLKAYQRWPGRQVAHFVHERLTETRPTEYCGCGSNLPYENCCKPDDLKENRLLEAVRYLSFGGRNPPVTIQGFIRKQDVPPKLEDVLPTVQVTARGEWFYEMKPISFS